MRRTAIPVTIDKDTTWVVTDPVVIDQMAAQAADDLRLATIELGELRCSTHLFDGKQGERGASRGDLERALELHLRCVTDLRALIATRDPDDLSDWVRDGNVRLPPAAPAHHQV